MSKHEGTAFGKWRTYFRDGLAAGDPRCWCVVGDDDESICRITGPDAEERAALIADAPELLRQRDALLAICERFCKRVEAGEVKSRTTYAEMKAAIAAAKGGA